MPGNRIRWLERRRYAYRTRVRCHKRSTNPRKASRRFVELFAFMMSFTLSPLLRYNKNMLEVTSTLDGLGVIAALAVIGCLIFAECAFLIGLLYRVVTYYC